MDKCFIVTGSSFEDHDNLHVSTSLDTAKLFLLHCIESMKETEGGLRYDDLWRWFAIEIWYQTPSGVYHRKVFNIGGILSKTKEDFFRDLQNLEGEINAFASHV